MIPSKLTIQELFASTRQYVVPLDQRCYVWTRERQWQSVARTVASRARRRVRVDRCETERPAASIENNRHFARGLQ